MLDSQAHRVSSALGGRGQFEKQRLGAFTFFPVAATFIVMTWVGDDFNDCVQARTICDIVSTWVHLKRPVQFQACGSAMVFKIFGKAAEKTQVSPCRTSMLQGLRVSHFPGSTPRRGRPISTPSTQKTGRHSRIAHDTSEACQKLGLHSNSVLTLT